MRDRNVAASKVQSSPENKSLGTDDQKLKQTDLIVGHQ